MSPQDLADELERLNALGEEPWLLRHLDTVFDWVRATTMGLGAVFGISVGILAGCSSTGDTATTFYKAEAGYTAALQAAAAYVSLPRCELPVAPKVCSKQAVVDQIRPAANSAQATVLAAEDTIRKHPDIDASFAVSAAQNAAQALGVILAQYGVGVK